MYFVCCLRGVINDNNKQAKTCLVDTRLFDKDSLRHVRRVFRHVWHEQYLCTTNLCGRKSVSTSGVMSNEVDLGLKWRQWRGKRVYIVI